MNATTSELTTFPRISFRHVPPGVKASVPDALQAEMRIAERFARDGAIPVTIALTRAGESAAIVDVRDWNVLMDTVRVIEQERAELLAQVDDLLAELDEDGGDE